jgi:hypothetical protein
MGKPLFKVKEAAMKSDSPYFSGAERHRRRLVKTATLEREVKTL